MWHKGVYYSPLGNIPLHHPPSQAASMQKNNVTQCTVTLYICLAKNDKIVHRYTVDKNSVPLCHQEEDQVNKVTMANRIVVDINLDAIECMNVYIHEIQIGYKWI